MNTKRKINISEDFNEVVAKLIATTKVAIDALNKLGIEFGKIRIKKSDFK